MSASGMDGGYIPDEPALFITTQTTIPQLTALIFAFSLAMIALASDPSFPETPLWSNVTTKSVAFILLGISALYFMFATVACVKSHAWDYYAVSSDRRKSEGLSEADHYQKRCSRRSRLWHKLAVWTYSFGSLFVMTGVAFLTWPISFITSLIVTAGLGIGIIIYLFIWCSPDLAESITDWLQNRLVKDQ